MRRSPESLARLAAAIALAACALLLSPATAGASSWTRAQMPGLAGKSFLLGVSCPSRSLCVAVGTNNLIASSTNPTGGSGAWDVGYAGEGPWEDSENWPNEDISGRGIQAVSCPSAKLCVAVMNQGNIYSTTNPTGPASAWNVADIDGDGRNTHLFGVSCPTASLCVAVSGKRDDEGKIVTSTNPTGGPAAWQQVELGQPFEFRALSCPTPSLCVAVAEDGRIVTSTNPTGGSGAWSIVGSPGGPGSLRAVACAGTAICVSGNEGGNLLTSTNPTGGLSSWKEFDGGGSVQITGASCASASACIAVDNNGDVLSSTNPAGGRSAWAFDNLLPFTQAEGNALFAASCPTTSLCVVAGARGQTFASEDPFAAPADPPKRHRRVRGRKRPRVKIASVQTPFGRQIRNGNGRVVIRFYARDRVRRYLCKFDHRPFRRCRSPKRYPVGVGRHLFQVRGIGVTGLKGPITRELIEIPRLCGKTPRPGVCLRIRLH